MGRLRSDFSKSGYSQEEAYFHEQNQKLIQFQRKKSREPSRSTPMKGETHAAQMVGFKKAA